MRFEEIEMKSLLFGDGDGGSYVQIWQNETLDLQKVVIGGKGKINVIYVWRDEEFENVDELKRAMARAGAVEHG